MIKKQEIIETLVDEGLTIIESDRILNSVDEFRQAIKGLIEEAISDNTVIQAEERLIDIIVDEWGRTLDQETNIFNQQEWKFGHRQIVDLKEKLKKKLVTKK